jgi:penicillin-insensitive murein endopeptidase
LFGQSRAAIIAHSLEQARHLAVRWNHGGIGVAAWRTIALLAVVALPALAFAAADDVPAKKLFGGVATPSPGDARPIGSYASGCLAGAEALPLDGPHWQVMRLSRNRNWGHPKLVAYIEKFSADAARGGWNGLLVGDMAQPRGGPMVSGHASHQIGLDVDIWFVPMPDHVMSRDERETKAAISMLVTGRLTVDPAKWSDLYPRLLKQAVSYPEVARIFVSPAIKKQLCETTGGDRSWLRKLRPWFGHDDHFHVRLSCPPGLAGCANQAPPPEGDGCGADLASWFKPPPPPAPEKPPFRLPPQTTLADLPAACSQVLTTEPGGVSAAALKVQTPLPRLHPAKN